MATVLFIAEDDPLLSRMYEKAFTLNGFDVKLSVDGDMVIDTLKNMSPKPAVVVLDIMMPKKSGFDVLREMKGVEELQNIPVVFLSNLAGAEDMKRGLALGASLYLIKSQYSPMEIVQKIKKVIE